MLLVIFPIANVFVGIKICGYLNLLGLSLTIEIEGLKCEILAYITPCT